MNFRYQRAQTLTLEAHIDRFEVRFSAKENRPKNVKKIPTLFERDWAGDKSRVTENVNPACQWVIDGEGKATQKLDGTACLIENGIIFVRCDAKHGKKPPPDFKPAQESPDEETGHWPGWVPAIGSQYMWQRAAYENTKALGQVIDGTYEACGPHFQANPEGLLNDFLIKHGQLIFNDAPRTFQELADWMKTKNIEGLVWHHPDGRMAKVKLKDFGIKRGQL